MASCACCCEERGCETCCYCGRSFAEKSPSVLVGATDVKFVPPALILDAAEANIMVNAIALLATMQLKVTPFVQTLDPNQVEKDTEMVKKLDLKIRNYRAGLKK